jgi:D-arginine dehydrogenase
MAEQARFDFIVVGAGIGGAGVAAFLAPDALVALLEMEERPGVHATGRSAALFAPTYGPPVFRALTRASAEFYAAASSGFTEHPVLGERGAVFLAREDQRASYEQMLESLGAGVSPISVADVEAVVPILRRGYASAALIDRAAQDMDVDAILQGYLRRGRRAGVQLFTEAKMASARRRDGVWTIDLPTGPISAPILINAAGAWADEVAIAAGAAPIGLRALRRTAALVDAPNGIDIGHWPMIVDIDEEFYLKPDAGKLLLSPADAEEVAAGDVYADELTVAIAVDKVQSAFDLEVRRINHSWAGLRTFAPDGEPVIGFDPGADGFFWCAGQGGYGIQSSPAFSRVAAALAKGGTVPSDIAAEGVDASAVSPARFR